MWAQIIMMVVSLVISYALRPKPAEVQATALADIDFPQADEGTPQMVIFGDVRVEDWMVLGVGNYRTTPIRK